MTKCPKCKHGEVQEHKGLSGIIFARIKTITFYCNSCEYQLVKRFKINEDQYQQELLNIK